MNHLCFLSNVGEEKNNYKNIESCCPFCNRKKLTGIIDEEGSILLLKNKFSTLDNTFQTVLIETDDCNANISTYKAVHMRKLIAFGIDHWLRMERSGDFKSVVFYKNHGPLSGGSINHPHMQIVGLKDINYKLVLKNEYFEGIEIYKQGKCLLTISTKPRANFTEFNIITESQEDNHFMADTIQTIVSYILNHFSPKCSSFNLFFYQWNEKIVCKIIPRFVTSPFLIGFSIPQTSNRLHSIAEEIRKNYYNL